MRTQVAAAERGVPLAAQERVGLGLEVVHRDAGERGEDARSERADVRVVARVVLVHHPAEPRVVALVGRLPGLAVAQPRVGVGHRVQPPQDEVRLDRHRLLAPERAVVVERRDALLDRDLGDGALDERRSPAWRRRRSSSSRTRHGAEIRASSRPNRPNRMTRAAAGRMVAPWPSPSWRSRSTSRRRRRPPRPARSGSSILVAIATLELAVMIAFSRIGRHDPARRRSGRRRPRLGARRAAHPAAGRAARCPGRSSSASSPSTSRDSRPAATVRPERKVASAQARKHAAPADGVPVGGGEVEHRALRRHDVAGDRRDPEEDAAEQVDRRLPPARCPRSGSQPRRADAR